MEAAEASALVVAATAGTVAVVFGWNRADMEVFAAVAASSGVSAAVAANPLVVMVSIVALARSFHEARYDGDYSGMVDGGFRGAASSVTTIAAMGAVGAAGGSAGAALLVGVVAEVLAHKTTAGVSLTDAGRFIADAAAKVSTEAPGATERVAAAINRHRSLTMTTATAPSCAWCVFEVSGLIDLAKAGRARDAVVPPGTER